MIGYVSLGSNDFEKAKRFYDAVLADLGGKRTMTTDSFQGYGSQARGAMLAICKPYDGKAASSGNGAMVALAAPSRELVDKTHANAWPTAAPTRARRACAAIPSTAPISATLMATRSACSRTADKAQWPTPESGSC